MNSVVYQTRAVSGRGKLPGASGGVNSRRRTAGAWLTRRGGRALTRRGGSALPRLGGACALLLALGACAAPRTIRELPPGRWIEQLGDVRNTSSLAEHVPAQVSVEWSSGLGRGLPGMPIVHGDLVIAVISGGGIVTASASSGDRYWTRRFNGSVAGQPVRVDEHVYFATFHRAGTVYALDLHRGRRIWSRNLGARAAAGVAYADGLLYVPTDRGELYALNSADGAVVWRARSDGVAVQAPLVIGDELLLATTRDSLVRIARRDGAVLARLQIAGMVTAPLVATGDTLLLAMSPGIVAAYAERGERELWRHALGAPVLAAPVATPGGVYALNRRAELFRLHAGGAARLAEIGGAATQSLAVAANGVLIGRLDGTLVFVGRDGTPRWEQQLAGSVRAPAIVRDSAVYVTTLAGRLIKLSS
jgi:outer membrane protein assembly factor BamB